MKNIAVITWKFYNYGTVLQAYALNKFINTRCPQCSCKLINYELKKNNLDLPKNNSIHNIIIKIIKKLSHGLKKQESTFYKRNYKFDIQKRNSSFCNFIKNIPQTPPIKKKDLHLLNKSFDYFICGSDQIWNASFFDKAYFLSFVSPENKKIAYAPSLGSKYIPEQLRQQYSKLLQQFDNLSTREKNNINLLEKLSSKKVYSVVDPTLLLDASEWESTIKSNPPLNQKYIFCYFLGNNKWYKDFISHLTKNKHYLIYSVGTSASISYNINGSIIIHPSPNDFISYIKCAQYIITDSFHATLFSINFNKSFFALKRHEDIDNCSENQRFYSCLQEFGLSNRYFSKKDIPQAAEVPAIDYSKINIKLSVMRKESIDYLFKSLNLK